MDFFSDTQETAACFGDYIADLHDVFRCNDVDYGAPEDFFAFARTLKYHSELRGDVLRVVKSVMESGTDISFRTILTVIAIASGGPDVAKSDRKMSVPVTQLIESLIGVGSCSQFDTEHPGLYPDLTVKETERAPELDRYSSGEEPGGDTREGTGDTAGEEAVPILAADESSSSGVEAVVVEAVKEAEVPGHVAVGEAFSEKATHDSSADSPVVSAVEESVPGSLNAYDGPSSDREGLLNDPGGSNTVAESLTRLELTGLQLKIYLDSIDQRISRMEPRLENVTPLALATPPAHAEEDAGARFSAAIASDGEVQQPRNGTPVPNQKGGAATAVNAASVPLAVPAGPGTDSGQYNSWQIKSGRRQIALPIFVGVAMLLLAAALLWRFGRDTGALVILPVNASMESGGNAPAGAVAPHAVAAVSGPQAAPRPQPASGPQVATGPGPQAAGPQAAGPQAAGPQVVPSGKRSAAAAGAQGESSASSYTGQEVSRVTDKPAASAAPSKKSGQIALRSPLRSSPSAPTAATPMMTKDVAEVTESSDDADDSSSVPLPSRLVDVPSGVMAANLLSAPKPSYPTLASLTRMQGNVVMKAVISKVGTVEELHVIKGHRLLRGAAKNAVRNWRYRPYKIDGVPVEVATTVNVEFSLHH